MQCHLLLHGAQRQRGAQERKQGKTAQKMSELSEGLGPRKGDGPWSGPRFGSKGCRGLAGGAVVELTPHSPTSV